jgi:hypothetical protein
MNAKPSPLLPKRPHRWVIRLGLVIVAGLAFWLWMQVRGRSQDVIVHNEYGKPIPVMKVTIGDETREFRDVAEGAEVVVPFRSKTDRLRVEVAFADKKVSTYTGVATGGSDGEPANLVILPTGDVEPRKSRK